MKPWELLDQEALADGGGLLSLHRRDQEYSIRIDRAELMNSRMHSSEEELARLACRALRSSRTRVLIGGLGMGFTLAEVLRQLSDSDVKDSAGTEIVVAELVPAVVRWNHECLGPLAQDAVSDPRVSIEVADVSGLIRSVTEHYDAIILDVDNGPDALTHPGNRSLYGAKGLNSAYRALRPGGVLTVWSAAPDQAFCQRLSDAGFAVEEVRVRARKGRGARHWIWVAARGEA